MPYPLEPNRPRKRNRTQRNRTGSLKQANRILRRPKGQRMRKTLNHHQNLSNVGALHYELGARAYVLSTLFNARSRQAGDVVGANHVSIDQAFVGARSGDGGAPGIPPMTSATGL